MSNITIYTKGYCPYCTAAKELMTSHGLSFHEIDVTNDRKAYFEMIEMSNKRWTVPQVFWGGKHIGGFSELAELNAKGELVTAAKAA